MNLSYLCSSRISIFVILFIHTSSGFILHPFNSKGIIKNNYTLNKHGMKNTKLRPFLMQQMNEDTKDTKVNNKFNDELCTKTQQPLPIAWSKEKGLLLFNIETTPDVWAIILVYFIQGLIGISRLALSFYYKDMLHLSPADLSVISSISVIPWVIKPLYGFISDTYPFLGYKRKSYLMLCGILSSISWGLLTFVATNMNGMNGILGLNTYDGHNIQIIISVLLAMMSSLGIAFSDVLVDAIIVTKSRLDPSKSGSFQSLCWSSSSLGGIISALFSGYLVQNYGSTFVFGITSIIPLIMVAGASMIQEDKIENIKAVATNVNNIEIFKKQMNNIWKVLQQKHILSPLTFLILWQMMPTSGSALFYFEVNELGFQPEFLGRLGLISSISSLLGIVIYNQKLKTVPLRTIFKWTCIIGTILGMTPLMLVTHANRNIGLSDAWFAIGDDIILTILGQIAFMPVLVLAANICPAGVEAMLYATLMGINNLTGSIGGIFGAILTKMMGITESNFTNLPLLLVVTNLTGLIPLMFINLIPKDEEKKNTSDS